MTESSSDVQTCTRHDQKEKRTPNLLHGNDPRLVHIMVHITNHLPHAVSRQIPAAHTTCDATWIALRTHNIVSRYNAYLPTWEEDAERRRKNNDVRIQTS
mmetsp:Transcript_16089/g.34014  ORF Transcript_16089/g.34014 Transcript_16089/m.34014 type:complete len:100 (+) Transcript_16089:65-364(+)